MPNISNRRKSVAVQKRVSLARAIALDPQIVFYDEPSAGLDPIVTAVIDKLMVDLTKIMGITSLVVTHDMNSAFRIADQMIMPHAAVSWRMGRRKKSNTLPTPWCSSLSPAPGWPDPLRMSQKDYREDMLGL